MEKGDQKLSQISNKAKKELAEKSDSIQKGTKKFSAPQDLDILLQYSRENFTIIKESTEYIEKKADDLLKFLVAIVGFFVALLGFLIKSFPSHHFGSLGWTVMGTDTALWITAIVLSLMARNVSGYLSPSTLEGLLSMLEDNTSGNSSIALRMEIIQNYEMASEVHSRQGSKKAGKLKSAYILSVIALFVFIAGLIFFSLSSPVDHSSFCFLSDRGGF